MKTYTVDIDVTIRLTEKIRAEDEDQVIEKARAIAYSRSWGETMDWDHSILSVSENDHD